ncbi:uncharacterized protein [Lepeophtheirus salmonis]
MSTGNLFAEEKEALDFIQSILRKKLFNDEDFYRFMKDGLIMEELVFTLVPYICIPKTISNQLHNRQAVDSIVRDCRSLVSQKIMAEEYTFRRKDISDPSNIGKAIKCFIKVKELLKSKKTDLEMNEMASKMIKCLNNEMHDFRMPKNLNELLGFPPPRLPPTPLSSEPKNKFSRRALACPPLDYSVRPLDRFTKVTHILQWFGVPEDEIFTPEDVVFNEEYGGLVSNILKLKYLYSSSIRAIYKEMRI